MMNDDTSALVRLPHTGLRVPDLSLSLNRFRQHRTSGGVAFSANLRVDNRIVGLIENLGDGGGTWLRADDWRAYGEDQLAAYAARCRSEHGDPITAEDLLDTLVDEHDWASQIRAARRRGLMVLRLMGRPPSAADVSSYPQDITRVDAQAPWALVVRRMPLIMPPGPHGWWQAWTDEHWRDVTPRPVGVRTDLYG